MNMNVEWVLLTTYCPTFIHRLDGWVEQYTYNSHLCIHSSSYTYNIQTYNRQTYTSNWQTFLNCNDFVIRSTSYTKYSRYYMLACTAQFTVVIDGRTPKQVVPESSKNHDVLAVVTHTRCLVVICHMRRMLVSFLSRLTDDDKHSGVLPVSRHKEHQQHCVCDYSNNHTWFFDAGTFCFLFTLARFCWRVESRRWWTIVGAYCTVLYCTLPCGRWLEHTHTHTKFRSVDQDDRTVAKLT